MTVEDIKGIQKRLENNPIPKSKPLIMVTEDVGVYNFFKVYSDIKILHLNGTEWNEAT